jgi:hypothetical protein
MNDIITWSGGDGFANRTLNTNTKEFLTELTDNEFEPNRNIDAIFYDHLKDRQTKTVDLFYSGGLDSEIVLMSCIRNKIPVEAITLVVKVKGAILNVVDLYYSEKFCRENNIKQHLFYLNAEDIFHNDAYLDYLLPYQIAEPHLASHFWLLERCQNFPVIGGDWPWVHAHKQDKVISPTRIDFCGYERYMSDNNITGIGNMIGHSLESCCYFIQKHIDNYELGNDKFHTVPFLKYKMYETVEPRIKSYGWETCPNELLNLKQYRIMLLSKIGLVKNKIKWGNKVNSILHSTVNENSSFV